jgi:hypothetical protein
LFIFKTPELIRNLWQLKTTVFLHWCQICAVPLNQGRKKANTIITKIMSATMCKHSKYRMDLEGYTQTRKEQEKGQKRKKCTGYEKVLKHKFSRDCGSNKLVCFLLIGT